MLQNYKLMKVMKYISKAYSIWELGQRANQEDSIFPEHGKLSDADRLFVLCDGMGGHSGGEVASGTVCRAFGESVLRNTPDPEGPFSDDVFSAALSDAYDALDLKDDGAEKKMGTTFTFLKLHAEGCTIGHIGDSRVYHLRPGKSAEDTEILFQTRDHSLVNDLVRIGELTPEEAKESKQKNVITRAMQPQMERRSKADLYHSSDIRPGDYFMICSDGILENFEDENIKFIFSDKGGDAANKVEMIVKATEHNRDNHTAIIVHILDVVGDSVEKPCVTKVPASLPETSSKSSSKLMYYVVAALLVLLGGYVLYKFIPRGNGQKEETEVSQPSVKTHRKEASRQEPSREKPVSQDTGETAGPDVAESQEENAAEDVPELLPASDIPQIRDDTVPNSDQQNVRDALRKP